MYLKSAFNTVERIAFPVTFVDMSAVRAFLTGVSGVDDYDRFTDSLSFISQKLFKLVKAPVIKLCRKLNSSGSALNSYAGKVFNSKYIQRRFWGWGLFSDSHMQVKSIFLSVIAESRSSQFPAKILTIISRYRESGFYSTFDRSKSNGLFNEIDIANPLVIPDSGILFTLRKFLKSNPFECFTGNISYSLKDRARKFWVLFSNIIVRGMVDRYFTTSVVIKTILSNLIEYVVAHRHRKSERFFIILRQIQFKSNSSVCIEMQGLSNGFVHPCAPRRTQ